MKNLLILICVLALTLWAVFAQATTYKFDFDSDQGHSGIYYTESGFTSVEVTDIYNGSGWGWVTSPAGTPSPDGQRDRQNPATDYLHRDFQFDSVDRTFKVKVDNGSYTVKVHFMDADYGHDNIDVYANDTLKLDNVSINANQLKIETFTITINTGELALRFHDDGGTNIHWIVNGIEIVPIPASVLLLGSGLFGLCLLGRRRKRS